MVDWRDFIKGSKLYRVYDWYLQGEEKVSMIGQYSCTERVSHNFLPLTFHLT